MIQSERIRPLNGKPARDGKFVLYWMQQAQRSEWNHALEYAADRANERDLPLVVFFCLTDDFPDANLRHYAFMLEGLSVTAERLKKRGIRFVLRKGRPVTAVAEAAEQAALVVTDRGYLRVQRDWREKAAGRLNCGLIEVETDVVVPVETAMDHEAYSAAVLRPKIHARLGAFLRPVRKRRLKKNSIGIQMRFEDPSRPDALLKAVRIDRSAQPVSWLTPGEQAAEKTLKIFLSRKLEGFGTSRNDPSLDFTSDLSPYLHFGQISPLAVAMAVRETGSPSAEPFLEELIVRRELSMNFVRFNSRYDAFENLPSWARETLRLHAGDRRPFRYTREALESAETHDPYWNAAQTEMMCRGKMHGYMRMYWGKKILEWTPDPEEAYRLLIRFNNRYFLDGRDPNGYAGAAWIFGKHDRPWGERPVFGKVRYMNDKGLERKFDMRGYVRKVKERCGA
ncbi:MAG: deoxyribodipyrimidine photo-lyase [bacterium]|nr:deoxyribodipyrimidine photo-lyase [bacterium]